MAIKTSVGEITESGHLLIWKNKNHAIEVNPDSLSSGWIIGDVYGVYPYGDNWIRYDSGVYAFDNPYVIPKYVKDKLKSIVERMRKENQK